MLSDYERFRQKYIKRYIHGSTGDPGARGTKPDFCHSVSWINLLKVSTYTST